MDIFFRCVEGSNEAIMICDQKGKLSYVNPAWTRIYGFSRDEALGNTPALLHSGIHAKDFYGDMWSRILNPAFGSWKGELVNKAKDGTLVPVLLTITPYRGPSGEVSGFMGIAVDMTYKRELEAKVAHQDRLASIGVLASGLAHEIGTPLGVVRGRAEFLIMKAEDPMIKKNLAVITSEIDRISKLIRSLLRVSRSFSDVQFEDVSPAAAVAEIMSLVGQIFRSESIDIQLRIPEAVKIRADFGRLEQVILNLVMNSLHAIQKAKASGRRDAHCLKIQSSVDDSGKTLIQVVDSGCGIAPENMKKLFRPFYTTKDVGEGTGLGLAIVSQIMSELKGEISVQSVVNQETTFTLTFQSASS